MSEQQFGSTPERPDASQSSIPVEPAWSEPQSSYAQPPPPPYAVPPAYTQPQAGLSDAAAGAIAYITIIPAIIFLLVEPYKSRAFVRFHSVQCLVLFGFDVAARIVLHFIPVLGWMIDVIVSLVVFVFWLIALIMAAQGKMYKVPLLGDIAANLAKE